MKLLITRYILKQILNAKMVGDREIEIKLLSTSNRDVIICFGD